MSNIEKYKATDILAFRVDRDKLERSMQQNLGSGSLSPNLFTNVVVPAGGGTVWQVESLEGMANFEAMVGVIVYSKPAKMYYSVPYEDAGSQKTPPDCYSDDTLVGIGNPGGPCHRCSLNEYGSAARGGGKACSDVRMVYMLREDSILPYRIKIPPTSTKHYDKYMARLAGTLDSYSDVLTALSLTQEKNAGGVKYSEVVPTMVRRLSDSERVVAEYFHKLIKNMVEAPTFDIDLEPEVSQAPAGA